MILPFLAFSQCSLMEVVASIMINIINTTWRCQIKQIIDSASISVTYYLICQAEEKPSEFWSLLLPTAGSESGPPVTQASELTIAPLSLGKKLNDAAIGIAMVSVCVDLYRYLQHNKVYSSVVQLTYIYPFLACYFQSVLTNSGNEIFPIYLQHIVKHLSSRFQFTLKLQ